MKLTISLLFILILSIAAFSQENKSMPEDKAAREEVYSSVFDIKDFKRFHILTQSKDSKTSILKILIKESSLELSDEPSKAQFFLGYEESANGGQLRAFYFKENARIIVWAENSSKKGNEAALTKEFLKVFKRNKTIK
ncbi:MAG: hypothetical protein H0X72_01605 [Acidobacteria bacterium]|jgi:hypothetical protein|nr:hypothetical protein [Acidobacteriota bacterium]